MTEGRQCIRVINPNSNTDITCGIEEALAGFRFSGGPEIDCVTLAEGPFGIETQAHVEQVAMPLAAMVERDREASAFVLACYSDPGLSVCREATSKPVFGIAECGVLTALARADSFGVIAIRSRSIRRHLRYLRQMALIDRLAGERPLEMSVAESGSGADTLDRLSAVGTALRDDDRAGAIVLGCAGMARHRRPLQAALGIPVVDPTQAAVAMAIGALAAT